jgi:type IV pilus assembly protein PilV
MRSQVAFSQRGALMIEVLITIVILAIGLTGLLLMQTRLQKSEVEAYSRTQALMLANDMADKIAANRANAANYVIGAVDNPASVGGGACPAVPDPSTLQQRDTAEWCSTLKGAAEVQGGTNVGALIGGRGCVYAVDGGQEYVVTLVWQGLTPISSPTIICGKEAPNPFDGSVESGCQNDLCRRSYTTVVRLGDLTL